MGKAMLYRVVEGELVFFGLVIDPFFWVSLVLLLLPVVGLPLVLVQLLPVVSVPVVLVLVQLLPVLLVLVVDLLPVPVVLFRCGSSFHHPSIIASCRFRMALLYLMAYCKTAPLCINLRISKICDF